MKRRILVVDDEAGIREMLDEGFTSSGFEVALAASAEEALKLVEQDDIQIYFLDLMLPEMNGVELCRRIRKVKPTAFIFAMTGFPSVFDLAACREAGFDDYFTKPFDLTLVIKTAEDAFARLKRWEKSAAG